ncbi:cupin domain-containing protein [Natrinema longum]|uniref:Cupin domain-containing protein n=1 Tax=Natrinema longum TaxID=370324 RepID=A0A8A2UAS5_9EURY|nr:cupin domain-containing protein [Natrinema longum]MBZ6496386.1 cupin domain-containing protein [Natrinema longum]QSW85704.1 cupin domain-containing protein [Natrinema longum]
MGYTVIDATAVEPRDGLSGDHYYLDDAVDLDRLSIQLVEADPGESFAPYHSHRESEEVFYVLDGHLHVETPDEEYVVAAGEWFAVEPGHPLRPFNPADAEDTVRALLLNAKRDDFDPYEPDR